MLFDDFFSTSSQQQNKNTYLTYMFHNKPAILTHSHRNQTRERKQANKIDEKNVCLLLATDRKSKAKASLAEKTAQCLILIRDGEGGGGDNLVRYSFQWLRGEESTCLVLLSHDIGGL